MPNAAVTGLPFSARSERAVQGYVAQRAARATSAVAAQGEPRGRCIWLTGLSGAGKTTIAKAMLRVLATKGIASHLLDGDEVRKTLSPDLGFGPEDRTENNRRIAEVARLLVNDGVVVIVACISPFETDRQAARERFEQGAFFEVFVETPIEVCETRDCKGLYRKARAGLIPEFTGVSSPYEPPSCPEWTVMSDGQSAPDSIATDILARCVA